MGQNGKVRYALVGAGSRARMFIDPLTTRFGDEGELVGLADPNPGRLSYYNRRLVSELGYHEVPTYSSDDFDRMVADTEPDVVIVTTVDAFHHEYVVRAMELGCDAITEKPMTTDVENCNLIMDAIRRTGRKLRVAFNYRWAPGATKVRQVISEGVIGDVLHVDLEYWLNTSHGADYFRRWHRQKENSGGLIIHKSTHHFDLVNWWIDAVPETVYAMGRLAFYGKENAEARGESVTYERYMDQDTSADPFAIDLSKDDVLKGLYLENEKHDGYFRDQNVFGEGITIEDSMSLLVRYRTGPVLNYSLNAYLPREGFQVAFNGSRGRLEYEEQHGGSDGGSGRRSKLVLYPMFGSPREISVPEGVGGHGGGDLLLQRQIFSEDAEADPFGRDAGHQQGAASVLVGMAANRSFETGEAVSVSDLCPGLGTANKLSDLT